MKKERIDILCVQQGLFESRNQAQRAIMAGIVRDENDYIDKPGTKIPVDTKLFVKGEKLKYVSRGGLKLEKAIELYNLDLTDVIMIDIGSSTGGFTDCALQHGAKKVYAVDVGTNQLVWKLRNDERVEVMEQYNFRYAKLDDFKYGMPTFASIDVSFISLRHMFNALKNVIAPDGVIVSLIKPQFEAGKDDVGKHGIVTLDINPIEATGQVKVNGEVWSAKTDDESSIAKGTEVEVLKIDGVKLVVSPIRVTSVL